MWGTHTQHRRDRKYNNNYTLWPISKPVIIAWGINDYNNENQNIKYLPLTKSSKINCDTFVPCNFPVKRLPGESLGRGFDAK